jgi:hypothetical protein
MTETQLEQARRQWEKRMTTQCQCWRFLPTWSDPAGATPCAWCEEREWRERTGADQIEAQQDIEAEALQSNDQEKIESPRQERAAPQPVAHLCWLKKDGPFREWRFALGGVVDPSQYEEVVPLYASPDWNARFYASPVLPEAPKAPEPSQMCLPNGLPFDAFGEPRTRYVRVSLDGNHCVMHPSEGDRYLQDARDSGDESAYVVADVYLSEREFDDLPEHDGF